MTSIRIAARIALAALLVAAPVGAQLPSGLDGYIERVRTDWNIVGLAVAVVQSDSVIYAQGFGLRHVERPDPVDEHTLFAIGSNTKAFTAAAIGGLVADGRMGWDDRVVDHLPWFELYDPWVTSHITVRDLLSHRSGLGRRGDANWYATDFSREEVVRRIRYLEPNSSFRSEAGYQNTMFLAAGLVTEAVAGTSWDTVIDQRIFEPLGMRRSSTSTLALEGDDNVATPHHPFDDGMIRPIAYRNLDNVAPAGSINSSVLEMTRWMRMLLSGGSFEGTPVLPDSVVETMVTPAIVYPVPPIYEELFPSTHFSMYGLGLGLRDYLGRKMVTHTGGIDGMLSQVTMIPEEGLGIVVLTNTTNGGAYNAVTFRILDALLDGPERDWSERFLGLVRRQEEAAERRTQQRLASRVPDTRPSLDLDGYAGTYEDAMYGRVRVRLEDGRLVLQRHALTADLEHWHYDTFVARWRDPVMADGPGTLITFVLENDGTTRALQAEDLADFARVADAAAGGAQ
jgi:CubicO group peptidase (beta-lactamase class C family)